MLSFKSMGRTAALYSDMVVSCTWSRSARR